MCLIKVGRLLFYTNLIEKSLTRQPENPTMITTDSSRKNPEHFFSDAIRNANQLLQDSCDVVRECMNDTQKAFTEAVYGNFVHAVPRYENPVLWREQFFRLNSPINTEMFAKLALDPTLSLEQVSAILQEQNSMGYFSLYDHEILPSRSLFHALIAYEAYLKGLSENNSNSLIRFKSRGKVVEVGDVFQWDPSLIYSGGGADKYAKLIANKSTYSTLHTKTNQLCRKLMLEVQSSMLSEVNDESFTSAIMLVGPSLWELDQVRTLHDQINDPNISDNPKKVDLFVVTQSLSEISRISRWSGLRSANLSVSIHGCDVRELENLNISRKSNSRLDTLLKGLTSGNFTEDEIKQIIWNSTRPDDKCYIDFQALSDDLDQVIRAYEERMIIELVSHNPKTWLMRLGVDPAMLHDFESKVEVSRAEYLDPQFSYAVPVVHHVDLDCVNPGIRHYLKEIGVNLPQHLMLCRSTRRDCKGFLAFLSDNNIPVYKQYDVSSSSGVIHGLVLGEAS